MKKLIIAACIMTFSVCLGQQINPNTQINLGGTDYLPHGLINVKAPRCGAVGNGIADDTAAVNACEAYARTHGLSVYWPTGFYKITAPINCQPNGVFPAGGLWNMGDQVGQHLSSGVGNNTTIIDALGVAGPVFDCGGDNNGGIRNMTITKISTSGAPTGSLSTSGILVSQGNSGFGEGGQRFRVENVKFEGTGDCAGCAAIAMPGVDEVVVDNVETDGGSVVLGWSLGKSTAVNSTFYNLSSFLPNGNPTRVTIQNSDIVGDFVPGIQFTGSQDNVLLFTYAAQGNAGAAGMAIEVTWPGSGDIPLNAIHFYGVRTENQSTNAENPGYCPAHPSATGCSMVGIMFGSRSSSGRIDGSICSDRTGYQVATEGAANGIAAQEWQLDCALSENLMNIGAGWTLSNVRFNLGVASPAIGLVDSTSNWNNDSFYISNAAYSPNSLIAALPSSSSNVQVTDYAGDYASTPATGQFSFLSAQAFQSASGFETGLASNYAMNSLTFSGASPNTWVAGSGNVGTPTFTTGQTDPWGGTTAVKIATTGGTVNWEDHTNCVGCSGLTALTIGSTYSIGVYVRGNAGGENFGFGFAQFGSNGNILTTNWQHMCFTQTVSSGAETVAEWNVVGSSATVFLAGMTTVAGSACGLNLNTPYLGSPQVLTPVQVNNAPFYTQNGTQLPYAITTTGSSGPATLTAGILNIPQYAGGGGSIPGGALGSAVYQTGSGATGVTAAQATTSTLCLTETGTGTVGAAPIWGACSGSAATAFSALTSSTNTSAAMLVGTGASLAPTGTGTINANLVNGAAVATGILFAGTNGSGQIVAATTSNLASFLSGLTGCGTANFFYSPASGNCQAGAGGMVYPGAGIGNSTGSAWGTSYSASNTIPANFISTLNQNTTGYAAALAGGATGSSPYQSAANATAFITSPTTSGHTFFYGWQPAGSAIAPQAFDLGTYLASPPAIGGTAPAAGTFTSVAVSGSGAGKVAMTPGLFASLAACTSGNEGTMSPVTDSTTNTWGATITGSGSDHVLAYCDGTNWTVMAQ